ncbi:hypothetical protein M409DRAFT_60828 [Zasmidium cellare ATCC 36951]|uniref:DUF1772-domain-containing protein n=1 Tax=Zasmidium cellare ATCC 36951 TaxID=1080233 RepID=A0A6A6BXC8_ZASCE|nr:uncharacterized protein M409DRAFT_60828 [Zasmidium cellare ATCC 36951]KAF2159484.1 hypothetical protein M409DRAFT_60828 [Zasmidium cellare ATCC 36951]
MSTTTKIAQIISISSALLGAGGIAALSLYNVPQLKAQPADRSLPAIRWIFSRGSHTFPVAINTSTAGFLYLAYTYIPQDLRTFTQLFKTANGLKVNGYLAASVLSFSIAIYTAWFMIPNNFALIKKNEEKGGARSANSARTMREQGYRPGDRSAEDSVYSKGEGNEFTDLSGPQSKTESSSGEAEDRKVWEMLDKFGRQNLLRAVGLGLGGVVGLVTALS